MKRIRVLPELASGAPLRALTMRLIQVTEATARLLADGLAIEPRGIIEIRGKGPMQTFLIHPPAAAVPGEAALVE